RRCTLEWLAPVLHRHISIVAKRPSPAVGPVPFAERIAAVGAAGGLSGSGIAALAARCGVRGGADSRGGDAGDQGDSGNNRLHVVSPGAFIRPGGPWHWPRSPCVYRELRPYDYVTESPNVSGDDRSVLPLADPARLAAQVEEPT